MKNKISKKINSDFILKGLVIIILCLSITYLVISLMNLIPFGIYFLQGQYYVDNAFFPNYSNVFNSIFTVVSIIVSGCFSWILYRINNEQKNNNYNINIASPAAAIYYIIKFYLLSCLSDVLKNSKSALKDEEIKFKNGRIGKTSEVFNYECPRVNTEKIQEYLFKMVGGIEETDLRHTLFVLVEDISSNRNIVSILKKGLVDDNKNIVLETSGKRWVAIFYDIYDEKWDELDTTHKEIMKKLWEISQNRK